MPVLLPHFRVLKRWYIKLFLTFPVCLPLPFGQKRPNRHDMDFDTIILGGGAAGLMCAAHTPGRCLVVDHAKAVGEKIRISGGGRCNFTNLYASAENFISNNPHFAKSALARYTQWDFIDWVARSEIPYHEKTLGQLFCDHSAKDIISMLVRPIETSGGQIKTNTAITKVEKIEKGFRVTLNSNGKLLGVTASNLVVATGGKPIPKMGATDFGLRLAQQFGLPVTQTRAGLVPYTFSGEKLEMCKSLAGVSAPCKMIANQKQFEEALLFTHRGLSGPASLQTSSYWTEGYPIEISLMAPADIATIISTARRDTPRKSAAGVLAGYLPSRLIPVILDDLSLPDRIADFSTDNLSKLSNRLTRWQLTPSGTEGYRTAEVMVGGVDTDALSSQTMESRDIPNLFFIGECVDVTGWLGGYNFQWAWSSGWVAAQTIKSRL